MSRTLHVSLWLCGCCFCKNKEMTWKVAFGFLVFCLLWEPQCAVRPRLNGGSALQQVSFPVNLYTFEQGLKDNMGEVSGL